jgi:hypothetical protein
MKTFFTLGLLLIAASVSAQPRPGAFTTLVTTSPAATSICVACPLGSGAPLAGSGITTAAVVLPSQGAPAITTNKLYSISGSLFFNGVGLAAGSSVSGTTGKLSKFTSATSLSDSLLTESGTTVTMAGTVAATTFTGSGTGLTGVGLLGSPNTWTMQQFISSGAAQLPLVLVGSDGPVSTIVGQFISGTGGRASTVMFSDGTTYASGLGTDGAGNLNFWSGRNVGIAGSSVFSVTNGGTGAFAGGLAVVGASTFTAVMTAGQINMTAINAAGGNTTGMQDAGFSMGTWGTTASAANINGANGNVLRIVTSLRAAKHDIEPIAVSDAQRTIMGLRGVTYHSTVDTDQREWAGFIAEEVQQANPSLAVYDEHGRLQSVTYDRVPAYLVPVVQDQERRIEALERALTAQSHSEH